MCEEAIDGVVTGRVTIVIYCLACVLSCLFVVFYLPLLIEFIKYIWTYKERMKQEEYEREQKEKAEEERKKAEEELLAKKAADSAERKLNNAKNKIVKNVVSKICGILGMNNFESCDKVVEMRGLLDCLHDKEDEVYKRAVQELQWDKKKWKLKGSERVSSSIVGLWIILMVMKEILLLRMKMKMMINIISIICFDNFVVLFVLLLFI